MPMNNPPMKRTPKGAKTVTPGVRGAVKPANAKRKGVDTMSKGESVASTGAKFVKARK